MSRLKLTYFDFHGGRGEAARLALAIGDVPFEDDRLPPQDWPTRKSTTPFGAIPTLEVDGTVVTQSNGINRYVGNLAGLYPEDPLQAALCDEVMDVVEELTIPIVRTFSIEDEEEKKAARTELTEGPLTFYLERLDKRLEQSGGEYFADGRLTVADLKVFVSIRHLQSGALDHIPTDLVARVAPLLAKHCARVAALPAIVAYYDAR